MVLNRRLNRRLNIEGLKTMEGKELPFDRNLPSVDRVARLTIEQVSALFNNQIWKTLHYRDLLMVSLGKKIHASVLSVYLNADDKVPEKSWLLG